MNKLLTIIKKRIKYRSDDPANIIDVNFELDISMQVALTLYNFGLMIQNSNLGLPPKVIFKEEIINWLEEYNIKCKPIYQPGLEIFGKIQFENENDLILFKLKWA